METGLDGSTDIEYVPPIAGGVVRLEIRRLGDVTVLPYDDAVAR
jgi:hypothetical protein